MAPPRYGVPNLAQPIAEANDDLKPTRPWVQFFSRIWVLVGGSTMTAPILSQGPSTPLGAEVLTHFVSAQIQLADGTIVTVKLGVVT